MSRWIIAFCCLAIALPAWALEPSPRDKTNDDSDRKVVDRDKDSEKSEKPKKPRKPSQKMKSKK